MRGGGDGTIDILQTLAWLPSLFIIIVFNHKEISSELSFHV